MDIVQLARSFDLPGTRTAVQLVLPDDLSFDEWEAVGRPLRLMATAAMWWVGDWCLYGKQRWPDRYHQAAEVTGLAVDTCRVAEWVAEKYDPVMRITDLSFYHHQVVASVDDPATRSWWLERARAENLSGHALRQQRKEHERGETPGDGHSAAPRPDVVPRAKVWVTIEADGEHFDMLTTAARKAVDGLRQWFETVGVAAKLGVEVVDDGSPVKAA
ncbi:MAG TPA: hypothetical protein VGB14_01670 [Acidimicrobiales bacterium]|jgi:hypothetical protein